MPNPGILKKPVVMVVDDDEFIQKLLDDTLNAEGYQVVLSGSYGDAMKNLQRIKPDIFVVDIILPDQNGLVLCYDLRQNVETKMIPIIILSSKHSVSDRVKGLQQGADDYLVKPFHLEELVARVQAQLRRRQISVTPQVSEPVAKPKPAPEPIATPKPDKKSADKKQIAADYFKERLYEEALQIFEEINREDPKDIDAKKYIEITRTQLMKKYLEILQSKDAIPIRTSNRPEDFVGLDFNTEEGFIFSRIDGNTDLKGIVAISGMKPIKAYGILYHFKKSGVVRLKMP